MGACVCVYECNVVDAIFYSLVWKKQEIESKKEPTEQQSIHWLLPNDFTPAISPPRWSQMPSSIFVVFSACRYYVLYVRWEHARACVRKGSCLNEINVLTLYMHMHLYRMLILYDHVSTHKSRIQSSQSQSHSLYLSLPLTIPQYVCVMYIICSQ